MTVYLRFHELSQRQAWKVNLTQQLSSWKDVARDAIGTSASIGLAVGGAVSTVAGAVTGLAQGLYQGASIASSSGQAAIMPPPDPDQDSSWERPVRIRRAGSTGDLTQLVEAKCPRCEYGFKKKPHTYGKGCLGLPASVYFPAKAPSPALASTSAIMPTPAPNQESTHQDSTGISPDAHLD